MRFSLLLILILIFNLRGRAFSNNDNYWKTADSLFNAGLYAEALEETLKGIPQIEKDGSCAEIAHAYLLVGRYNYYLRQKIKAISWFNKSNQVALDCGIDSIVGKNYRNIGAIYWEISKPDSANFNLLTAASYLKKVNQSKELSTLYAILFELHFRTYKDVAKGKQMLDSCEFYALRGNDKSQEAFFLMKKGIFLMETNRCKEAQEVYFKSEKIYRDLNNQEGIAYALNGLAISQALCNEGEASIKSMVMYNGIRDQLFQNKTAENLAKYEARYNTKQKQIENKALKQKNRLLIIISVIAFTLCILIFLIVYFYQQRKKERLHQQKVIELQRQSFLKMMDMQEKERTGFAADLHDGLGHLISAIQLNISALELKDERNLSIVENASKIIKTASNEIRHISHRLMPQSLVDIGLLASIKELVHRLSVSEKLKFELHCEDDLSALKKDFQIALYRIIQEVLSNMMKHAEATLIKIEISTESNILFLKISDNGKGFEPDDLVASDGIGWQNIKSRVDLFKGHLEIVSSKHNGTVLLMNFMI